MASSSNRQPASLYMALALSAAFSASCFAVADVERFHAVGAGGNAGTGGQDQKDDPTLPSSLVLTLNGMKPHFNQLIEFRVVDNQSFVQCRGVIDPISGPALDTATFHLSNAISVENGPFHLDLYGDLNGSGNYDGLPTATDVLRDHAWRIEPLVDFPATTFPHEANRVKVIFQHNVQFTDIGAPNSFGLDVVLRFPAAAMAKYVGDLVEVRIVQAHPPFQTVGLYRNPQIPGADFTTRIRGVAEPGDDYSLEVYVDSNGNGHYESPATPGQDGGWRFQKTVVPSATDPSVGIDLTFDPTAPGHVEVGEP